MLKEQEDVIHKIALLTDAFLAAYVFRDYLNLNFLREMPSFSEYLRAMAFVIPLWVILLDAFGVYSMRQKKFSCIFWTVFEASKPLPTRPHLDNTGRRINAFHKCQIRY